jgi:hypothetical protein
MLGSQNRTVPSSPPLAISSPPAETATLQTVLVWPCTASSGVRSATHQARGEMSREEYERLRLEAG